jgi:hypothetical protein
VLLGFAADSRSRLAREYQVSASATQATTPGSSKIRRLRTLTVTAVSIACRPLRALRGATICVLVSSGTIAPRHDAICIRLPSTIAVMRQAYTAPVLFGAPRTSILVGITSAGEALFGGSPRLIQAASVSCTAVRRRPGDR